MANGDFVNFRAVYDELTDEVGRAHYQFLPDHLRNWFHRLDTTPRVAGIVAKLQSDLDFEQWWKEHGNGGMAGAADVIQWPRDGEKALGMKLLLFRAFSEGRRDRDIAAFGFQYVNAGNNINANAQAVIDQVFLPMARELRRYLERNLSEVPAADRVVRLDHNSGSYRDAIEALEKLERVIREANDYPDAEDSAEEEDVYLRPLRKAFIDLGYTEGENIHFEHRFPAENPERFQTMARELVDLKPDAIIAVTTPPMQAPASFNLDAVKAQVEDAIKAHQGD